MAQKMMVISDLTNGLVPDGDEVSIIVRSHPMLDEQIMLDAGLAEVKPLMDDDGEYVVLDITRGDKTKHVVAELAQFNLLFRNDALSVLAAAKRVPTRSSSAGAKRNGNAEHLAEVREWCRGNGWPDLKDKGRVPVEAQTAYDEAHAA